MWQSIAEYFTQSHGLLGVIIVSLGLVIAFEAATVAVLLKKYIKQLEKCQTCMYDMEEKHDLSMEKYYAVMREENEKLWARMETATKDLSRAVVTMTTELAKLTGRLTSL